MDFKIIKTEENPNGTASLEEVVTKIGSNLEKLESDFILKYEEKLKELDELKLILEEKIASESFDIKSELLKVLNEKGVFSLNTPIEINYPPSLEKKANVKTGTFYRDSLNDRLRVKCKTGWTTVTLDR